MCVKVKMLKDWEDMGKIFKKGKIYRMKETKPEGEFYTNNYHLIPKTSCEITEKAIK